MSRESCLTLLPRMYVTTWDTVVAKLQKRHRCQDAPWNVCKVLITYMYMYMPSWFVQGNQCLENLPLSSLLCQHRPHAIQAKPRHYVKWYLINSARCVSPAMLQLDMIETIESSYPCHRYTPRNCIQPRRHGSKYASPSLGLDTNKEERKRRKEKKDMGIVHLGVTVPCISSDSK